MRKLRAEAALAAGRKRAQVFVDAARSAEKSGGIVAAAQNYRLALQACDDPEIRSALGKIAERARTVQLETSVKQAREYEGAERWAEASVKWLAAYECTPEPWIAERIANALTRHGSDLRRAVHFAEQAVLKEPTCAAYRVTLAEAFLAAGLMTRASGEAARALAIEPGNAQAKDLVSRLDPKRRR